MKHLTIILLVTTLCFSALMSCGGGSSADAGTDASGIAQSNNDRRNYSDNLTKEEKIERMNAAQNPQRYTEAPPVETNPMVEAKINAPSNKIGSDQAEQSSRNMRKRYEDVMNKPVTSEQKLIADKICKCLSDQPIFKTVKKAKNQKEVLKLAGDDKDREVKALQDCYNTIMVPAVNNLGQDAGVFAMKTRTHLNKNCLDGTDNFWISIGGYLGRNAEKATIEIDMPKIEKGLIKNQ